MVNPIRDDVQGAFCAHLPEAAFDGAETGPLARLTFGAKDLFDIKGHKTGAGNPDWLNTHDPAPAHAAVVETLLGAGADLVGKTHTDELAFSLNGENHHYGTPVNPNAPGRIPGGSSGGSASAVAGKLVDFALGTDTGGSVRVPASYCGIYGIRTTHGRVDKSGLVALAPSFDCIGWFARSAKLMHRVGEVLLAPDPLAFHPRRLVLLEDMLEQVEPDHAGLMVTQAERIARRSGLKLTTERACDGNLQDWFAAMRRIQVSEVWQVHGEWIETHRPVFGPGIAERFAWAENSGAENSGAEANLLPAARALRETAADRAKALCRDGGILLLPSSAGPAPLTTAGQGRKLQAMDTFREHAMRLTCFSGLSGCPQVSAPLARIGGLPVGLSFMTARNTDLGLLKWLDSIL